MLSLRPPPLLLPPHPATPANTQAIRIRLAYASLRLRVAEVLVKERSTSTKRTIAMGMTGWCWKLGKRVGAAGGTMKDRVVVRVAVQDAAAVLVAAVGTQVAAAPSVFDPFLN